MRLGADVAPEGGEQRRVYLRLYTVITQFADDIAHTTKFTVKPRPDGHSSCVNIPMRPKMSRMEGTKITSKLTTKRRQNAMPMCMGHWKGLSGKKIWSKALRIYRGKEGKRENVMLFFKNKITSIAIDKQNYIKVKADD